MRSERRVIEILALPGVQLLDVAGPLDVFAEANRQAGRPIYEQYVVAEMRGAIETSSGVCLVADRSVQDNTAGSAVDTVLVAGRPHAAVAPAGDAVIEWLLGRTATAQRLGSVCSGAFYLAAAGLLAGRRVTTHWAVAGQLAAQFPDIIVDEDAIHVRDGPVRTAAGVTAGLDLALALVEEDLGKELAIQVASQLVMFFRRPGGQLQFRRDGGATTGRAALQRLQRWIAANPGLDHSVASLAARMDVSPRHFARIFRSEVGVTPATWVEEARIEAARRYLEEGHEPPKQIAGRCGYADVDSLRRAFVRRVGVTPSEYRKRFGHVVDDA